MWEVPIKTGPGKLSLLPRRPSHLAAIETLPPIHRDPFDRMLVAQARAEDLPILSDDSLVRKYGGSVL